MRESSFGLFFSEVHTQQTSSHSAKTGEGEQRESVTPWRDLSPGERELVQYGPPLASLEESFRHGGWASDRKRVRAAMLAAGVGRARIERFDRCGANAVVEVREDGQGHRVRADYCGDRWCAPCMKARAKVVQRWLEQRMKETPCLFVTLTLAKDGRSLSERLRDLRQSFSRLIRMKEWKDRISGGAAVVQITRGKSGGHWHVHLHAICCGKFLDAFKLSAMWRKASGHSYVVDVRRIVDIERRAAYVSRYATKGADRSVICEPDALVECIVSLRGARMLSTWGGWYGCEDQQKPEPVVGYRRVGRLVDIINAAERGERWAIGVLACLGRNGIPESLPGESGGSGVEPSEWDDPPDALIPPCGPQ